MLLLKPVVRPAFARFLCVGATCFTINLGVLYGATEILHLHYLVATTVSILVVNGIGFFLNRNWTFESQSGSPCKELLRYFTVHLGQFGLNLILMAVLVSGLRIPYLLASASIAIVMAGANFLLHKNWSFAAR